MNYSNLNCIMIITTIICIYSITLYRYLTHKSYLHIVNYTIKCNKYNLKYMESYIYYYQDLEIGSKVRWL